MSESVLRVALIGGDRYTPLYARLEAFTAETGLEVEVVRQSPLPELTGHLFDALPGGAGYHLVSAHSQYTAGLAPYLLPLDAVLPEEELQAFSGFSLDLSRWEGRIYQAPRAVETRLLFYRSDIFEERREKEWFAEASGGQELRAPRSWEELAAVAQYFTRPEKMYGFAFPGRSTGLVSTFAEILTTVGGTFFDAEARPRFYSRAGEWALTLLRDLHQRWAAVPPDTPELHYDEVSERFRMGKLAMTCDFPDTARLLRDPSFSAVAGWHSVALYPSGPGGRLAVWTGCPTFAIPAACPDPVAAAELLRFLTGHESQLLEAKHGAIPSRTAAHEEVREELRDGTLAHLRFTLVQQTLRLGPLAPPKLPRYHEIEEALWPLLQEAITGEIEVLDALQQGRRAVEALLEEDRSPSG